MQGSAAKQDLGGGGEFKKVSWQMRQRLSVSNRGEKKSGHKKFLCNDVPRIFLRSLVSLDFIAFYECIPGGGTD